MGASALDAGRRLVPLRGQQRGSCQPPAVTAADGRSATLHAIAEPPVSRPVASSTAKSRGSSSSGSATPLSHPSLASSTRSSSTAMRGVVYSTPPTPIAVIAHGVTSRRAPSLKSSATATTGPRVPTTSKLPGSSTSPKNAVPRSTTQSPVGLGVPNSSRQRVVAEAEVVDSDAELEATAPADSLRAPGVGSGLLREFRISADRADVGAAHWRTPGCRRQRLRIVGLKNVSVVLFAPTRVQDVTTTERAALSVPTRGPVPSPTSHAKRSAAKSPRALRRCARGEERPTR